MWYFLLRNLFKIKLNLHLPHKHLKIIDFMKKVALFSMAILFSAAMLTSCASECYTCGSGTGS